MNLFKVSDDCERNAREKITGIENYKYFMQLVTLLSLTNKVFYSPVSFLIEYNNNPTIQKMFEEKTGINKYTFLVEYMEEFPTVASSRKLKSSITSNG